MTARDPNKIIDDLGFRAAWLEKTVSMNIERLDAIAAAATGDPLGVHVRALAEDTRKSLFDLQIFAADRMGIRSGQSAEIIKLEASSQQLPRPELVTS